MPDEPVNEVVAPVIESSAVEIIPPVPASEPATAQMGGSEPLTEPTQVEQAPVLTEPTQAPELASSVTIETAPTEPPSVLQTPEVQVLETPVVTPQPTQSIPEQQTPVESTPPVIIPTPRNPIRELFAKAQSAIQFRKRKKLDRIMNLFAKQTKITNDEVEKLLHVSDATATRYLSTLEKEGKIQQKGKIGHAVSYSKI